MSNCVSPAPINVFGLVVDASINWEAIPLEMALHHSKIQCMSQSWLTVGVRDKWVFPGKLTSIPGKPVVIYSFSCQKGLKIAPFE